MKKELLQIVKASVLGLLTLILLVITVFEILPPAQTSLAAKDTVTVSSALISSTSGKYQLLVSGTLFNDSDDTVKLDSVKVTAFDRNQTFDICIPLDVVLGPRAEYALSYSVEHSKAYEQVKSVSATVDGIEKQIANADQSVFSAITLLLIALTLIAGYFCYRSILVCYYAKEEKSLNS